MLRKVCFGAAPEGRYALPLLLQCLLHPISNSLPQQGFSAISKPDKKIF
jgi:hypothetical protein